MGAPSTSDCALSIPENRGDYSAHAADDGNEQREQDVALPVDLGVERIEAPVDAREPEFTRMR